MSAPDFPPTHLDTVPDLYGRLILVRHAATEQTGQGRYTGRGDPPLSESGRRQAVALARRLSVLAPEATAVLSSPLARARQTAEVVADRLGLNVTVEEDLAECDLGLWEGLTFSEIHATWPDELAGWLASAQVPPPGGESFERAGQRFAPVLAAARRDGGTTIVVGHASMVKLVLRDAVDGTKRFLDTIEVSPASLSIVDTWPDGGTAVRTVNETAHL